MSSNDKQPSCDTCHQVFFTLGTLRRHIAVIHSTMERPRFPCSFPGCSKTYLYKRHILEHVKIDHAKNPVRFPCTLCGKEFKTRTELERHIPTHTTEKPYNCATCGRSYANRGNMISHQKTHLEKSTRPVSKCHVCPQTFLSSRGLQYHIRAVHESRRDHPCEFCDKRLSTPASLKRHVGVMHVMNKGLIRSCDKCEYKSYLIDNLARHRMRHNPARHECYFCRKKFFSFGELGKHFSVHTLES
ncbi:oocyte zinc finger protein XlCOF14 [Folsomia candida]|uniref:C2H2-type domain-containing protein n=1 Tax=Folsomia candida TaxID=158441 RepID=A0A226DJ42_FOLCA|nr:oocyte zinc finger protein XlCOF14 [Folsomia candida]OXA45150.1 hypothetical protein Fcan01_20130 [Folsomia candida]